MRKYEVIFIVKPLEEEPTNAVIEKFSKLIADNGGASNINDISDEQIKDIKDKILQKNEILFINWEKIRTTSKET